MRVAIVAFTTLAAIAGATGVARAGERHLFYIHGCCIDKVGGGAYEEIVESLRRSGFKVAFDLRKDDGDEEVRAYAAKVGERVKALLAGGTAPGDITVSGYSLGAVTALHVAIGVANPWVNYVLLAGCPGPRARRFEIDYARVQGRVLSVIDVKDDRFGSCKASLPEGALQREIAVDSGIGHAMFRQGDANTMRLWMEPLEAWSRGQ